MIASRGVANTGAFVNAVDVTCACRRPAPALPQVQRAGVHAALRCAAGTRRHAAAGCERLGRLDRRHLWRQVLGHQGRHAGLLRLGGLVIRAGFALQAAALAQAHADEEAGGRKCDEHNERQQVAVLARRRHPQHGAGRARRWRRAWRRAGWPRRQRREGRRSWQNVRQSDLPDAAAAVSDIHGTQRAVHRHANRRRNAS